MHNTDVRNHNVGRKRTWVPVRRAERRSKENSNGSIASHALKLGKGQSAEPIGNSTEKSNDASVSSSVHQEIVQGKENLVQGLQVTKLHNDFESTVCRRS